MHLTTLQLVSSKYISMNTKGHLAHRNHSHNKLPLSLKIIYHPTTSFQYFSSFFIKKVSNRNAKTFSTFETPKLLILSSCD